MGIPALNASTIGSKLAGFPRFRRLEGALTAFAAKARCRHLALAVAVVALALALVALVLVTFALLALAHLPSPIWLQGKSANRTFQRLYPPQYNLLYSECHFSNLQTQSII